MRSLLSLIFTVLLIVPFAQAQATVLKIATFAPDGTQWMQELRKGGEEIDKRTEGRVTIKLYPGGSMGSDRVVLRKIREAVPHLIAVMARPMEGELGAGAFDVGILHRPAPIDRGLVRDSGVALRTECSRPKYPRRLVGLDDLLH